MSRIWFAMCVLPLAACGSDGSTTDIAGTLLFADRSDVEISRLVNAASGSEGFQAQATAETYTDPSEPDDPCPGRMFANGTGTITGGCTTLDEVSIEGSITIENPLNWCLVFDDSAGWCDMEHEGDFTAPTIYTFAGLTITQSGFTRSFDGVLTSATLDGYINMDITSAQLGVSVRSDIHVERDGSRNIDLGGGVELVGVGGARVAGDINVSSTNQTSGSLTLDGADVLKVTIENNCTSWRVDGTQRMFSTCP